jgi:hypothetical protein
MMESLGELTDMELGLQVGDRKCMRLNAYFRDRFEAYVKFTGIKSRDAMSPFWRGWLGTFCHVACTEVDLKFVKMLRRAGVTGFR